MQRKRFYATQLMKLCFQALLYASLFVSFFGMLSITNEAILNISRTAGTTIATFVLTMLLLSVVYGGYEIGVKKMRSVFASISLATFFTDLITYVMLQIMNTNPNNPDANPSFTFWGEDLALLFGAFILQLLMIYLFVALGYRYYFRINPPLDCCIVASSQELAEHVASKMATFRQRYRLTDVVLRMPGRKADHSGPRRGISGGHSRYGGSPAGSLLLQAQQNHLPVGRAGGCGHLHRPAKHSG